MAAEKPLELDLSIETLSLAVKQNMLSGDQFDALCKEAHDRGLSAAQVAVENGVLTTADLDIVQALAKPRDIAPGYEILSVLGHGGLGVVYRARQINLDRLVALKTVLLSRMDRPGALARFELEAKAVGALRHPNIVTAYDYGTNLGRLFFAMELVEGDDLDRRLAKVGRFNESMAWSLVRQVAAGLSHAANAGIVHRDIKPGNLLLTDPPEGFLLPAGVPMVKITDFGLAFLMCGVEQTRLTQAGTTLGTPQYMAPEQFSEPTVDLRADIYSLGATAYHLIAGRPPFSGESAAQILASKLKNNKLRLSSVAPGVSPQTVQLIDEMMADDPFRRPSDYRKLIERIDGLGAISLSGVRTPIESPPHAETIIDTRFELSDEFTAPAASLNLATPASIPSSPTKSVMQATIAPQPAAPAPAARPAPPEPRRRSLLGMFAMVVVMGGAAAIIGTYVGAWNVIPFMTELVPTKWEQSLFNGKSLQYWKSRGAPWQIVTDVRGLKVIEGEGAATCRLPTPDDRPLTNYRFTLGVDLYRAQSVEIHFGVVSSGPKSDERNVVRLTPAGALLGRQDWKTKKFVPVSPLFSFGGQAENDAVAHYHQVAIERQKTHWQVAIDGVPLGRLPITGEKTAAAVGVVVNGGPARFDHSWIVELGPGWW